jgi:hypothetical protein
MEWRIAVFPVASALVGALAGYVLARWVAPWLGWVLAAAGLAGAVALVVMAQGREGYEGMGYMIVALLMAAPGGLGAALGTVFAALQAARRGPK